MLAQPPAPSPSPSPPPAGPPSILEVIATTPDDALAAARGGADRLEVVSAMEHDGLNPDCDTVQRIRAAVSLPLRLMLRPQPGFTITAAALDELIRTATTLRNAGLDQFVFGFLTPPSQATSPDAALDPAYLQPLDTTTLQPLYTTALQTLAAAIHPARWTLHRAFDHTPDQAAAFATAASLPGLDRILTSGSPHSLDHGLPTLRHRAAWQTPTLRWIAGGGLRAEHIPPLRAAGISEFHTGRAVRLHHRWDAPIDERQVTLLKEALHEGPSNA